MNSNKQAMYDQCVEQATFVITGTRKQYPRLAKAITIAHLLKFIGDRSTKILEPNRRGFFSLKRYTELYNKLKDVKVNKFYSWIVMPVEKTK